MAFRDIVFRLALNRSQVKVGRSHQGDIHLRRCPSEQDLQPYSVMTGLDAVDGSSPPRAVCAVAPHRPLPSLVSAPLRRRPPSFRRPCRVCLPRASPSRSVPPPRRRFPRYRLRALPPPARWRLAPVAGPPSLALPLRALSVWRTYSMTSSARASSIGGTSSPSVLAVLRLITSSYLVGACTGKSAGFSPLRMRST